MFRALTDLFKQPNSPSTTPITTDLAVAAILVHLARADGSFSDEERNKIIEILQNNFGLDHAQVLDILEDAKTRDADAVDLYQFTTHLTKLDMDQRVKIIKMMWSIVFADNENHELEDNLVWRVAELIGVSARDRTTLRAQMRQEAGN